MKLEREEVKILGEKDIIWFLVQYEEVGEWYIHRWKITRIEGGRGVTSYANLNIYLEYSLIHVSHFSVTICSQYDKRLNPYI